MLWQYSKIQLGFYKFLFIFYARNYLICNKSYFDRKIKVGTQANMGPNAGGGFVPDGEGANGPDRGSKLELFGFDSLVDILGLRR